MAALSVLNNGRILLEIIELESDSELEDLGGMPLLGSGLEADVDAIDVLLP